MGVPVLHGELMADSGDSPKKVPWAQRVAVRVSLHIPEPLLAGPERVFINLAAILMGLTAFGPPKGSVPAEWPVWFQVEWGVAMVVAGLAALHGTWTNYRPSERLGAGLFAICALVYAVTAIDLGRRGTFVFVIFGALSVAKVVRIIRSLAASGQIATRQQHGESGL
jgi:hypothetical protein